MMRSLYSGVSGLNNHQVKMDVIGNNVSNVNTYGFKKGRVNFQDIFSQTLSGAARPTEEKGGINPKQVGLGMSIAAIDTLHTQGSLQTTGVNTDVAIMGNGFFVEKEADSIIFSRKGAYSLDRDGKLVNPTNGFRVQGYQGREYPDGSTRIDASGSISDITIPIGEKDSAKATSVIRYKSNLNSRTPIIPAANPTQKDIDLGTWQTSVNAFDSKGNPQEVQLNFSKSLDANGTEIPNQWRVNLQIIDLQGRIVTNPQVNIGGNNQGVDQGFLINFNPNGSIANIADPNNPGALIGADGGNLSVNLNYTITGSDPMQVQLDLGTSGDYDGITQFASNSSTKAYYQNGFKMGYLTSFAIDDTGVITGTYDNGNKKPLARLALAKFLNPAGLEKTGESYFVESNNSGSATINPAGSTGIGKIKAGVLEMSNVDLANEFTEMITTQRGFQANSRTITTSDTMLEELLRLKR